MLFAIVSVLMIGCAKDEAPEPQGAVTTNEEVLTKTNLAGQIVNDAEDGGGLGTIFPNPRYYPDSKYGFKLVDFKTNLMGNIVWRLYDSNGILMDGKCITPRSMLNPYNSRVFITFPKGGTFSITATYSIPAEGGLAQSLMVEKTVSVISEFNPPWDPSDPGTGIRW